MYLVRNGANDYKFRTERATMALQDTHVSDLVVGKFGHRSGKKLAFDFFCSPVCSWIGGIHQFGMGQPRRRYGERLGFRQKGTVPKARNRMSGPDLHRGRFLRYWHE
jgi:hypothetical protein